MAINKAAKPLPDLGRLQNQFDYCERTGNLFWKAKRPGVPHGGIAGSVKPDGYVTVTIDRQPVFAHRIIWKLHHGIEPPPYLDHINGNPSDNRPDNLRAADKIQNGWNRSISSRNKTGVAGVTFDKQTGKYRAQIRHLGKLIPIGRFSTIEEAAAARAQKEKELFGEFSRGAA